MFAVGYDAWVGESAAVAAERYDWAVFHAPEPGPDEDFHRAYEAADPSGNSFVYQEWGMACDYATWTTCPFSTADARTAGFLARYGGREAKPAGCACTSVDQGKAGYGLAWAKRVEARVVPFRYDGVALDDVNVFDSRLPNRGLPDGYADSAAYERAVRVQLEAAREYLRSLGLLTMGNVGGIVEWESAALPADDLVGVLDYTSIEFCGTWPDGSAQGDVAWTRIIRAAETAHARGAELVCQGFRSTRFNDHLARILGSAGAFADGNDYRAPWPWDAAFAASYGPATGSLSRSGSHLWRSYQDGTTLHVDLATLGAWETTT